MSIRIPSPTSEFREVGDDNRRFMEVFVPQNNRIISGFVLADDLSKFGKGGSEPISTRYAMVEVLRAAEYKDCGANDFKEFVVSLKKTLGDVVEPATKDAEEEFNRRMKSLDLADAHVSIEKPILLGPLFSNPSAYSFGMVTKYSGGGVDVKMAVAATLLRVKNRLLFIYLYDEYKNNDTIMWLRRTAEEWSDGILKENK